MLLDNPPPEWRQPVQPLGSEFLDKSRPGRRISVRYGRSACAEAIQVLGRCRPAAISGLLLVYSPRISPPRSRPPQRGRSPTSMMPSWPRGSSAGGANYRPGRGVNFSPALELGRRCRQGSIETSSRTRSIPRSSTRERATPGAGPRRLAPYARKCSWRSPLPRHALRFSAPIVPLRPPRRREAGLGPVRQELPDLPPAAGEREPRRPRPFRSRRPPRLRPPERPARPEP